MDTFESREEFEQVDPGRIIFFAGSPFDKFAFSKKMIWNDSIKKLTYKTQFFMKFLLISKKTIYAAKNLSK